MATDQNKATWRAGTCLLLLFLVFPSQIFTYKHIIFMHGIFGNAEKEWKNISLFLKKDHPGTNATVITAYEGVESLEALWTQVNYIKTQVVKVMNEHPEGVHLLCFSQGGLVCRGLLQILDKHNVHTFISLSSPQAGQFGDTDFLKHLFPHYLKEELYEIFYSSVGQKMSIANYWNDPHHQALYRKYSKYLAVLNNETSHPHSHEWRANFLRVKKVVLIGGPDDGVITPWQSSHFSSYNSNETAVNMRKEKWYVEDSFGLRTLDKRGDLILYTVPGVEHELWHSNYTVWKCCMEKWLD